MTQGLSSSLWILLLALSVYCMFICWLVCVCVNRFCKELRDLESRMQRLIKVAFETVNTVQDGVWLLDVFRPLCTRKVCLTVHCFTSTPFISKELSQRFLLVPTLLPLHRSVAGHWGSHHRQDGRGVRDLPQRRQNGEQGGEPGLRSWSHASDGWTRPLGAEAQKVLGQLQPGEFSRSASVSVVFLLH